MNNPFLIQQPHDKFLATLVDYYFYMETPIDQFKESQEYVMPFPRITFGYFFDHPFMVTNHDLEVSEKVDMVISRISTNKITVLPLTDKIKILGAHVKPYTLAHLTDRPINALPWLIDTIDLFGKTATDFRGEILNCLSVEEMFEKVEQVFLNTLIEKDLQIIKDAVDTIELRQGYIQLRELADRLNLSDRALRDHFHKHIGCAPKEFIQLVQLKQSILQMSQTENTLTEITYDSHFFDQAHFINAFKKITGRSPKNLRKEMAHFRFLQF